MRIAIVTALVVLLAGCMGGARDVIAERGAEASDQGLQDAEWYLCHASPVGAIKRRYGTSPERVEAYRELCSTSTAEPVIDQ